MLSARGCCWVLSDAFLQSLRSCILLDKNETILLTFVTGLEASNNSANASRSVVLWLKKLPGAVRVPINDRRARNNGRLWWAVDGSAIYGKGTNNIVFISGDTYCIRTIVSSFC